MLTTKEFVLDYVLDLCNIKIYNLTMNQRSPTMKALMVHLAFLTQVKFLFSSFYFCYFNIIASPS